jgi:hypothetical protein
MMTLDLLDACRAQPPPPPLKAISKRNTTSEIIMDEREERLLPVRSGEKLPWYEAGDLAPVRTIVVNGLRFPVRGEEIDHSQLVRLAYPEIRQPTTGSSLTVTYRGGPNGATDGILAPTARTPIADGETFVVTRTDKS